MITFINSKITLSIMEEPQSAFLDVFGNTPMLRLLDFLVVHDDFDYSMTDIARLSNVHYVTLRSLWPKLERSGMVVMTRKVGKAKMFKFNKRNPIAKRFHKFFCDVTRAEVRRDIKEMTVQH